jgi:hypothetical protein
MEINKEILLGLGFEECGNFTGNDFKLRIHENYEIHIHGITAMFLLLKLHLSILKL